MQQSASEGLNGERGSYRAYERIGGGGFGSVFFGRSLTDSRPVAIKRLYQHFLEHASVVARFEREAALVLDRGLVDPNIVRILDRGRDAQNVPFLIMEWVEGWTVSDVLRSRGRPLTVAEAAAIGCQTLSGLAAAHRRGVIHRDIKPANLMVTREGRLLVMDLGIAKETDPEISAMTGFSGVPVTLAYAAPEQLAGVSDLDGRADLFAVGATLYQMLAGVPAFNGPARDTPPAALNLVVGAVPVDLAHLVQTALARDRTERFHSAEDMERALRPFATSDLRVPINFSNRSSAHHTEPSPTYLPRQPAWLGDVQSLLAHGQLDSAIEALAEAHRDHLATAATPYAQALRVRAAQRELAGQWRDAQLDYEAALDVAPAGALRTDLTRLCASARLRVQIRGLQAFARRRFEAGDWVQVVDAFEQLRALDPTIADDDGLMAIAEARLAEAERLERELAALYEQAAEYARTHQWAEAVNVYAEIERQRAGYRDVPTLLAAARRAVQEAQEREARRAGAARQAAESRRRAAAELYDQAQLAWQSGAREEAIKYLRAALELAPDHDGASVQLAELLQARTDEAARPTERPPQEDDSVTPKVTTPEVELHLPAEGAGIVPPAASPVHDAVAKLVWPSPLRHSLRRLATVVGVLVILGGVTLVAIHAQDASTASHGDMTLSASATVGDAAAPTLSFEAAATNTLVVPVSAAASPTRFLTATLVATKTQVATPTVSATLTLTTDQRWSAVLAQLDPVWGKDWSQAIAIAQAFYEESPDYGPAQDKLYAAFLFAAGDQLDSGNGEAAASLLVQAQSLNPDRPEAGATLQALTPTATPTPTRIPPPAPTARPVQHPPPQAVPPPPPPTLAPVPAGPPTKLPFRG